MTTKRATIKPETNGAVPLRGPSGRLYGYLDRTTLVIEFKRGGQEREQVDLKPYLEKS